MKSIGTVYLVGAGPGDVHLLTLRGAELLGRADVVVYDSLVNPELLRLARPQAALVRRDREAGVSQEALNALLVEHARAGKCVVRLKGGDPYVFGRGGEEAVGMAEAKVPFEVVPGISSVMAAPNYAGIPLTHRACCSTFTVITGHADPTRQDSGVDWEQLAKAPGTKVILMGAERIARLTAALLAHGLAAATPAAMVRWGTTARQQTLVGTVADIAQQAERAGFGAPVVTVIGEVVRFREKLNWFERRPLFGQRVVVTRAKDQASPFVRLLEERGAQVLEAPTIKTIPPTRPEPIVEALAGLGCYDWIIFTSANGVVSFFDFFFKAFDDLRDIGGLRIAAVGPATAEKLRELHLKVDLVPQHHLATEIARALAHYQSVENLRILLARAEAATPDLPKKLEELGAIVDDVACYRTVPEAEDANGAAASLLREGADWITFTSASTVESFHARFDLPQLTERFPALRLATIGPETTKALASLALTPAIEAKPHTTEGLVAALERAPRRPQA